MQTTRPSAAQGLHEALAEQPLARRRVARGRRRRRAASPARSAARRRASAAGPSSSASSDGRGAHQHARHAERAGPARRARRGRARSGPAPAATTRRARRAPRPRPGRAPAPTPPPGCRSTLEAPARAVAQSSGMRATAMAGPAQPQAEAAHRPTRPGRPRGSARGPRPPPAPGRGRRPAGGARWPRRRPAPRRRGRGPRRERPGAGGGTRRAGAAGAGPGTAWAAVAVRRTDAGRPAQRHAAQSASSSSSGGGPQPGDLGQGLELDARRAVRRRRRRPSPPTRRPCEGDAHHRCRPGPGRRARRGPRSRTACRGRARRAAPARPDPPDATARPRSARLVRTGRGSGRWSALIPTSSGARVVDGGRAEVERALVARWTGGHGVRRRRVGPVRGRGPTSAGRPGRCAPR